MDGLPIQADCVREAPEAANGALHNAAGQQSLRCETLEEEIVRTSDKREREKKIVSQMITLYCRKKHRTKATLCAECAALDAYARERSDKCPFMETKTFCSNCKVHCYRPDMRERIREVMRFSGPRMIFYHPVAAVRHLIESRREKHSRKTQK